MTWREQLIPAPMLRAAIVAPEEHMRRVLVEVADSGTFEPDPSLTGPVSSIDALVDRATSLHPDASPLLSLSRVEVDGLATDADFSVLLGEAELEQRTEASSHVGRCVILPGWIPTSDIRALRELIAPHGGAVTELPTRHGLVTPTVHADSSVSKSLRPLVSTYATVPYRDIDPTLFAALSYMVMFGMMFGDVAHGFAIVALGVVAYRSNSGRLRAARPAAPFLIGAGLAAMGFGLLYGEAFGPTGLVPTIWFRPLDDPMKLLLVGLVVGSFLLATTFVLAIVNRWREAGPAVALYDASGIAGALIFAGGAAFVGGIAGSTIWLQQVGGALAIVGLALTFIGMFVKAGRGGPGLVEAIVETFDTVLRLGSNVVSFTRLAAFGLTHAVITAVVWDGTVSLWNRNTLLALIAATTLFAFGNLAAFTLGALVGAIQALRLEYYEMFSRLFATQGRPFEPWHIPTQRLDTS
jgi:V/A-type H+-transporting ATPase subunit I